MIISISTLFLIIFLLYYFIGIFHYKKLTQNNDVSFYALENNELIIEYKLPIMSFGSGHKYIYLFSKNHFLIDKCRFGEFPINVNYVDEKNRIICFKIADFENQVYIQSWLSKNKKIGSYKILYEYTPKDNSKVLN